MDNTVTASPIGNWGFWQASGEPVYYDPIETHELDIQNMADEKDSERLATSDLPHREGK